MDLSRGDMLTFEKFSNWNVKRNGVLTSESWMKYSPVTYWGSLTVSESQAFFFLAVVWVYFHFVYFMKIYWCKYSFRSKPSLDPGLFHV